VTKFFFIWCDRCYYCGNFWYYFQDSGSLWCLLFLVAGPSSFENFMKSHLCLLTDKSASHWTNAKTASLAEVNYVGAAETIACFYQMRRQWVCADFQHCSSYVVDMPLAQMIRCGRRQWAMTSSVGWRKRWAACRACASSVGTWPTRPGDVSSRCGWTSSDSTASTPTTSDRVGFSTVKYRSRSTSFTRRRRQLPGILAPTTTTSTVFLLVRCYSLVNPSKCNSSYPI